MKILITGVSGFVGSRLASALKQSFDSVEIVGIDNLLRQGSEGNRAALIRMGVKFTHGDVRSRSDVESLESCDWVIDAAANPSVLAGVDGHSTARQLAEHNLSGTLNILEYCRERKAGLILLSSSRVYSVRDLAALPLRQDKSRFVLESGVQLRSGVSDAGITEVFPTSQPISLYGATKLSSEIMAIEYGMTFGFPVWINRCGVLAGAGQFGTAEQGIFSYWLHAYAARAPLRYIGFGGCGLQVRDAFHPFDLVELIIKQLNGTIPSDPIFNVGGGLANSMSLAELSAWCSERFGAHPPVPDDRARQFDVPWLIMDSTRVETELGWRPSRSLTSILEEIEAHVHAHPDWLKHCGAV
ncbi:MAG: NAD-dependent epimerase/dehydratase family protein [Acidobacteriaceae bacterium]|nr:NAD-dependent epimerase/dehydratase family protein [Acidobacteriaceae bacterium]